MNSKKPTPSNTPVVILCGGMGTRLAEETETKPKPLVEIGGKPILWHIMKSYAYYGFSNFILCLGYKGHLIRDYFLNYDYNMQDIRIRLGDHSSTRVELLNKGALFDDWSVTLADTGSTAMTGARIKRIERYVQSDYFMLTYGDGVANVNLGKLLDYHYEHQKIGTVTGVHPTSRFGELAVCTDTGALRVDSFQEKPAPGKSTAEGFINGGFFVFSKKFFSYLLDSDDCILERSPLEQLSHSKELMMFKHEDFWQCMDTMRDVIYLRDLWSSGRCPWKVWI